MNFTPMNVSVAVLGLTMLLVLLLAFSWHRDAGVNFDLRQCVIDSTTGKISVEKVAFMSALTVSTWGFVTLILTEKMTEFYFAGYIGAFGAARFASQYLSVKKDANAGSTTGPNP
jgi:hypothetical protein